MSGTGFIEESVACHHLVQGYICRESGRTVRVRLEEVLASARSGSGVIESHGYLTIKGRSTADGVSRSEWEYEIPGSDAEGLMGLCTGRIIDKHRYIVPAVVEGASGLKWEVDVFHGVHEGLVLAEIEMDSSDCRFERPNWLGEEVTGDRRYYNSVLSAE